MTHDTTQNRRTMEAAQIKPGRHYTTVSGMSVKVLALSGDGLRAFFRYDVLPASELRGKNPNYDMIDISLIEKEIPCVQHAEEAL